VRQATIDAYLPRWAIFLIRHWAEAPSSAAVGAAG
jgi:hypothetical protein